MNVPDWLRSLVEPAHSAKRAEESRRMRLRHDLTKLIEQLNDLDRDLRTRFSSNRNEPRGIGLDSYSKATQGNVFQKAEANRTAYEARFSCAGDARWLCQARL